MYIVTRRYRLAGDWLNEVVRRTEQEGLPVFKNLPGFVDYYYLHSKDSVMTISVYESRESAEESNRLAAEWVKKNIPSQYAGPPDIFSGEVLIHAQDTSQARQAA